MPTQRVMCIAVLNVLNQLRMGGSEDSYLFCLNGGNMDFFLHGLWSDGIIASSVECSDNGPASPLPILPTYIIIVEERYFV